MQLYLIFLLFLLGNNAYSVTEYVVEEPLTEEEEQSLKESLSSTLTTQDVKSVFDILKQIFQKADTNRETIFIGLGRSPVFFIEIMKHLGMRAYNLPISWSGSDAGRYPSKRLSVDELASLLETRVAVFLTPGRSTKFFLTM